MVYFSINIYTELLSRKDCPKTLLDLYLNQHLPEVYPKVSIEYFRIFYLELLIGSSYILEQLDGATRVDLMKNALSKIQEKKKWGYSVYYQSGSAIMLTKALCLAGLESNIKENDILNQLNENGTILNKSVIGEIETLTNKYLESHE